MNEQVMPAKDKLVVFDLDGTLACGQHRLHLLPAFEDRSNTHKWEAFNLACVDDAPIQDNIDLCNILGLTHRILILTGRGEVAAEETIAWLDKHGVNYDSIIMRGRNDHRIDIDFKKSVLEKAAGKILCCFDDLEHVAEAIRSWGITCHLVTKYHTPKLHERDHRNEVCCKPTAEEIQLLAEGDFTPEELWGGPKPTCPKCIKSEEA